MVVLVLVAAYISIGRYYIDYVEQYQETLVDRFASFTGLPIQVGRLYGDWSKLSPVLTLESLQLYSPDDSETPVLVIDAVKLQLDPLKSLLMRSLQIRRFEIDGLRSVVQEYQLGKWRLRDYPVATGGSYDNVIDLLLSADSVFLKSSQLTMIFYEGEDSIVLLDELSLRHEDDFRRIKFNAAIDDVEQPLQGVLEAHGDPRDEQSFSARAYLQADDVDFGPQLPAMRALNMDMQQARLDSEIWVDWKPGRDILLQGYAAVPVVDLAGFTGKDIAPVEQLEISFRARRTGSSEWQAWFPNINAQWQEQYLALEKVHVRLDEDGINVAMPSLSLDELHYNLAGLDIVDEQYKATLKRLSPAGIIENLQLFIAYTENQRQAAGLSTSNKQLPRFKLRANLNLVGVEPWHGAPGARNISGYLEVLPTTGMVELDSEQFSLDFTSVYRQPLDFASGLGQVRWTLQADRVLVDSGPLLLTGEMGAATGLLALDLPLKEGEDHPRMTLVIGIRDADTQYRSQLIPYTLNEDFLQWINGSIPRGRVLDGGFVYRGSLLNAASEERSVQLYFNVADVDLDYHSDWPMLSDISGRVLIDDANVDVTTQTARIFDLDIPMAHVTARPLAAGGMLLSVDARAEGDASQALRVVNESVIDSIVGSAFQQWRTRGPVDAKIKLGIPLAGAKAELLSDVQVDFKRVSLELPEQRVQFADLQGSLFYSADRGIYADALAASLFGLPLTASIEQTAEGGALVDIAGRIRLSDVAEWSRQPAVSFASGETDFNAQVFVAGRSQPGETEQQAAVEVDRSGAELYGTEYGTESDPASSARGSELRISSQLQGVNIDLPAPYFKAAQTSQAFSLVQPLTTGSTMLNMRLDDIAELQLQFIASDVISGLVVLDSADNHEHREGQIIITGYTPSVVLDQWAPVWEQYQLAQQHIDNSSRSAEQAANASPVLELRVRDLLVGSFTGEGLEYQDTLFGADRVADGWQLRATNEALGGQLYLPDSKALPMRLEFDKLVLPGQPPQQQDKSEEEGLLAALDPRGLPAVDVTVEQLYLGKEDLGDLRFELRSDQQGLRLDKLQGTIRGLAIGVDTPGLLTWERSEQGDRSSLITDLNFKDIGKTLEQWNYEGVIESEKGAVGLDLNWPGSPDQWQLKKSAGNINLTIRNGRFLKTSDTASSTLKVVGIINFTNIIRRLQLDFSDVYKSGISYDRIRGKLALADGQLTIVDDLSIKTPSSRFHLKGDADLHAEQLDMELVATLPVVNNLPWIAALAGGLPTAAGVYVASKIFESQVDSLSSAVYDVKGDWNNPELKFKRIFDVASDKEKTESKAAVSDDTQSAEEPES